MKRPRLGGEGGAVVIFVALMMVTLLAIMGLAIDVGWLTYVRSQAQAAVDTAALAAASGIPDYRATGDASTICERLSVLNAANDVRGGSPALGCSGPDVTVEFVVYQQETNTFTCESGCDPTVVNAVRVTKTGYDTPIFFGPVREWFGADPQSSVRVDVAATAYLGCPSECTFTEKIRIGPIALRECKLPGYPESCDANPIIQSSSAPDNSQWTTFNLTGADTCQEIAAGNHPPGLQKTAKIGDEINLVGSGQATSCLKVLDDRFAHCSEASCAAGDRDPTCTMILPIIDCGGPESRGIIRSFAEVCVTEVEWKGNLKEIRGPIVCDGDAPCESGGPCQGLLAKLPVLVR